MQSPGY